MNEMLLQGLELMAAGMGTVFLFLIIMVYVMHLSGVILRRMGTGETASPGGGSAGAGGDSLEQVAVAIAAAKRHTQG
mgnify:CR=1 FL=1